MEDASSQGTRTSTTAGRGPTPAAPATLAFARQADETILGPWDGQVMELTVMPNERRMADAEENSQTVDLKDDILIP
jgi:hypothetical protein